MKEIEKDLDQIVAISSTKRGSNRQWWPVCSSRSTSIQGSYLEIFVRLLVSILIQDIMDEGISHQSSWAIRVWQELNIEEFKFPWQSWLFNWDSQSFWYWPNQKIGSPNYHLGFWTGILTNLQHYLQHTSMWGLIRRRMSGWAICFFQVRIVFN